MKKSKLMKRVMGTFFACMLAATMILPAAASEDNDTAVIGITADPGNLSSITSNTAGTMPVVFNLYTHLINLDGETGEYTLDAAESMDYEDDTHILVKIREDIYDSNGNNMTASDVLFSMNLCPSGSGPVPNYVRYIDLDSCEVVDDYTLRIVMSEPYASQNYYFCRMHLVTEAGYNESSDGMITDVVATGPYKLVEYVSGSSVSLTANEYYYGDTPEITNLEFRIITESSQITNALETGTIDYGTVNLSDVSYVDSLPGYTASVIKSGSEAGFFFNMTEDSIFNNKEARQAVAYCVDAAALAATCTEGFSEASMNCFPGTVTDKTDHWDEAYAATDNYYSYDLEKAQELADSSGLTGQSIVLCYTSAQATEKTMAEMTQSMLSAIGVDSTISVYDDSNYNDSMMDNTDWDISFQYYGPSDGSSIGVLVNFVLNTNLSHLNEDTYDKYDEMVDLINSAATTIDEEEREGYTNELIDMLVEDLPFYGCFDALNTNAYNENIEGITYNVVNTALWQNAHFTD